jgi:hypothetical protein
MTSRMAILALCLGCFMALSVSGVAASPFSSDNPAPSFFSKVETSSTTNLNKASITTELGNRFTTGNSHGGVGIYNNVQVSSYSDGVPSKGSVSAFIKGTTMGGKQYAMEGNANNAEKSSGLSMALEFFDFHSMNGDIISFSKSMRFGS